MYICFKNMIQYYRINTRCFKSIWQNQS